MNGPGRIQAIAIESFRETRSPFMTILILLGGVLIAWVGLRLPAPLEGPEALAGAFFFGGVSLVLTILAMISGALAMAADRSSGFHGLLLSKPLSGPVYFLGRFAGQAVRLTLTAVLAMLFGGIFLQLFAPGLSFSRVQVADRITIHDVNPALDDKLLLLPGGPALEWLFRGPMETGTAETDVRFRFRPRFPASGTFDTVLPLKIAIAQEDHVLFDDTVKIINRKSLDLAVRNVGGRPVRVTVLIPDGSNALEISGSGCTLALGSRIPLYTLLLAAAGFLPLLYLSLAAALMFSAMVSVPTAFFSTAVLGILVLMGPSLQLELELSAAQSAHARASHQHETGILEAPTAAESTGILKYAARFTAKALSLLPDPRTGGVLDPLIRNESPRAADMITPWKVCLPYLLLILALGCLLAGRRIP